MAVFFDYKTGGIAVVLNRRQHSDIRSTGKLSTGVSPALIGLTLTGVLASS